MNDPRTSVAERLRALGHPVRLTILRALAASGPGCSCGEIVDKLPLAQSTVSQHLKVLKDAGLIRGRTDGSRTCYCLAPETIAELRGDIALLMETLAPREGTARCST